MSTMAQAPARRRVKFSDLQIGERFYDPISAEYFVKQTETLAAMVTGIGDGSIPDEFEPDDIVRFGKLYNPPNRLRFAASGST